MKEKTLYIRKKRGWFIRDCGKILGGIFLMVVAGALFLDWIGHERVIARIDSLGMRGPVMIVGIRVVTSIFPVLTGTPGYIASGYLFGVWDAFVYNTIGNIIGISLSFFVARRYGLPVVKKLVGKESTEKIVELLHTFDNPKTFARSRTIFFFIDDIRNYAAGMSRLSFFRFFLISLFVISVSSYYLIYVGHSLASI